MKMLKKIVKNKIFVGTTLIAVVAFFTTVNLTESNLVINDKVLNSRSARDVEVAEPNIYEEIIDISSLGADIADFEQSFILSNCISPFSNQSGNIQLIKISDNNQINWELNGAISNSNVASSISLSSNSTMNSVTTNIGLWSNSSELGTSLKEQKNSLFIQQVDAKPNIDNQTKEKTLSYSYSDIINSASDGFVYEKTTLTAPPYLGDASELPPSSSGPNFYYKFRRNDSIVNTTSFNMNFSPLLINFGVKTNRIVPNTTELSRFNYFPYIKSSIRDGNQYNILSGTKDGAYNIDAKNYGLFFNPDQNFSYFSGIFDSIPNSMETSAPNKKFGQYIIAAQTSVSSFEVKFNSDNQKLPSQKLKEIKNNPTFFNSRNFGVTAANAIPSTFYGSKIKIIANDNNGTLSYEFIPGIGANVEQMPYSTNAYVYSLAKPITTNLNVVTQGNWKRLENTIAKKSYELVDTDFLYQDAVYAQIAATDNKYLNPLKELIKQKIIYGNVPPSFNYLTDIRIDNLNYINLEGKITFNLFIRNVYENFAVSVGEKDFGTITISGFRKITSQTEITKPEISINEQNVLLSKWLEKPHLIEEVTELIKSSGSIINLPDGSNIVVDPTISSNFHPPEASFSVGATKVFKFDQKRNDYYIDFVDQSGTSSFLPLGSIKIVGFEEVWPTEIIIPPSELDNNKQIYPSQFTEQNAIDIVFRNVSNPPSDFNKSNVIISNFSVDNIGGIVSFDAKLNRYYDSTLNLITNDQNFPPIRVNIINFKNALGPTTFINTFSSIEWSQLTVFEFSDENINAIIRAKCFTNLLPDAKLSYSKIKRNALEGEIIVEGNVDKYFDENSNYKDVSLGDKPLVFSIRLINFFRTGETTIHTNKLNVSLPQISPLDVQEKVLKNKLLSLIDFKPKGFGIQNILFQTSDGNISYVPDNTKGKVTVNLGLNLWYNSDGLVQNSFKNFGQFEFTGLKITTETILPSTGWENFGNGYIASEVAKNKFELIAIINSGIQGDKPDQWNPAEDIIICDSEGNPINDVSYDNKTGTIDLYVKLRRFYNAQGVLETQWNKEPVHITIGGFRQLVSTSVVSRFKVPNVSNELPTQYSTPEKVKKLIENHKVEIFSNPPSNFDVNNDMIVKFSPITPNPNNLIGEISIDYSITNYFNADGLQETSPNRPLKGTLVLWGFKHIEETVLNKNVIINGLSDIVASTLTKQQVLNIVEKNNSLFFSNQPEEGIKIQNVNITNNQLNLEGKLEIEITYSNYFDSNGNLVTSSTTSSNILISGFKKVKKTTYKKNIVLPKKSSYFPNELTPSLITNILSDESVLPLFLSNIPPNFSSRDILEVNIIEKNNLNGSVTVNLKIVNYYDAKGNIQFIDPLVLENVIISNFSSNKPTVFFNSLSIPSTNPISSNLASEISNQDLSNFIFENINQIADGLPNNFSILNLRSVVVKKADNLIGSLVAQVSINNFIDENGVLQVTTLHKWDVTINGFRNIVGTEIQESVYLNDVSSVKPSDIDNIELINIIMRNKASIFNVLPDNFNEQNIIVKSLRPNDSDGYLVADISITSYFDSKGNLQNANNPLNKTITFFNFGTVVVTKFAESYSLQHVGNFIASEFSTNRLKELIYFNLNDIIPSLPENFSYNDIRNVEIVTTDNLLGTLVANISITNFYNPTNGLIDTINTLSGNVLFTGFKPIAPTSAKEKFEIKVSSNVVASEFDNAEVKNYITKYYDQIFSPLPSNFAINNIVDVNIVDADNINGQINVNVTLNCYFDEYSSYSEIPKTFNFTITGFTSVRETIFNENVTLNNISDISAYTLSSQDIIDLIYRNKELFIENPGPNFSISNINFNSIDNIDNKNGVLEVSINYTNYYNSKGELILGKSIVKKHFIHGFATNSKITEVATSPFLVKGYSDILAQELSFNSDKIKEIIYQNINTIFNHIPQEIQYSDISINNIEFDNIHGSISLKLLLSKYYNKDSILINDISKRKSFDIVLTGFKPIKPTRQSLDRIIIPSYDDILASSSIDIATIKNFIWGKKNEIFESLPSDITLKDINIEISSIDNIKGELTIYISLSKWYSNTGELQVNSSNSYKLILSGFKSITPTKVNNFVNISFPNNSSNTSYYAETITVDDVRNLIVYNKDLFFNCIPENFNSLNIQTVQILSRDNINGKIKIKFSFFNYFNDLGSIEKNKSMTTDVIEIGGFFNVNPTTVNKKISVSSECYNNLASDYKGALFDELNNIIVSKKQEIFNGTIPFDANISLTSVDKINNLDGTASVTISANKYFNDKGVLINKVVNYSLTLIGFRSISTASTIAGQNFSISSTSININLNQLGSVYYNYFSNIIPSNVSSSPQSFLEILTSALNSSNVLVQNGIVNSDYELIKISNLNYWPNSANDIDGTLTITADVCNYWDNINGEFNKTPLPITINLSGFKTTLSSQISPVKIIILIIIIIAVLTICLLIALFVAKFPKIFKKRI